MTQPPSSFAAAKNDGGAVFRRLKPSRSGRALEALLAGRTLDTHAER
jgi:hypothetical protein